MNLPSPFVGRMQTLLGEAESTALLQAIAESPSPVSIRCHPHKTPGILPAPTAGKVPWCAEGIYLQERPRFTYDPLLHAGCYYVQEASSMFVEQAYNTIVRDFIPRRMIDLCAAPGGKSTLWRSLLPAGSLLVSNEPVRQRAQVLTENMAKWGHPDVVCTCAFPAEFASLVSYFDVVAADVPCSGEGMFRKDGTAVSEWSVEAVGKCAERQWQIVHDIWSCLRQGGYMVYSTCTYNREENEDNVVRICRELGAEIVPIDTLPEWDIQGDTTGRGLPVYHFFPHHTHGEGLFLALLRKTSETPVIRERKRRRQRTPKQPVAGCARMAEWLKDAGDYNFIRTDETHVAAVRKTLADDVRRLSDTVFCTSAGVALAEEKGRKLIPCHALALSLLCRGDEAFARVELSLDEALSYLRREVLVLPGDTPRGYVIATYMGRPIGFLNNLGTRANNLYPAEWRIRN